MRKYLLFFVFLLFGQFAIGQIDTIKISGTKLISTRQILSNENKTKDTILYLYRLENRQRKLVKKFYLYKDEGGDCNNLFWNIGTITTQNDSLIFLTRYLQKGHDPIPVIRKRIYHVAKSGELKLLFDKYKKRNDKVWRKVDYEGE
jgi:hypothetical protein